ncbi:MAG TPA: ABC transporter ATP-binding protein, partial [Chloroflexia bacterium]|nr:ABC transporter ATP-binding protein [Chloroflexia bacterium]
PPSGETRSGRRRTAALDPARTVAVREVSLQVRRGEVLSLLGPSGCRKTTVLRLLAGLERPDGGEVRVNGQLVSGRGSWVPPEKRRVGLVFQDYALFPHMTVARNIAFPLSRWPATKREARVTELLEMIGMPGMGNRYPHQLSGGQQQRVALARALAPEPDLVLMDEPFSSLDAEGRATTRDQVRSILKSLGTTVIFVTHDQEEALLLGDRVAVMNAGQVEQVGTPEAIFQSPATRFVAEFLGLSCFLPGVVTPVGLQTEIGLNPQAAGAPCGTAVEVLVRPDDLLVRADPLGDARVVRCMYRGMDYLYDVALPSGTTVRCIGTHTVKLSPGTPVRLELSAGHALTCVRREDGHCRLCEPAPETASLS